MDKMGGYGILNQAEVLWQKPKKGGEKMFFKKCPECNCVFGCMEMTAGEVIEKTCSECPDNKKCILHTTENYRQLFEEHKENMLDYYCSQCIYLHNQKKGGRMKVIIIETEEERERRKIIEQLKDSGHKIIYVSSLEEAAKIMLSK